MRKIVDGIKDENGMYLKLNAKPQVKESIDFIDFSIDDLIKRGIRSIYGILKAVESDVGSGSPSREMVQNLKDVMTLLKDLKKEEKEFLENLSDEELQKLVKKD